MSCFRVPLLVVVGCVKFLTLNTSVAGASGFPNGMLIEEGVSEFAYRQGLFVLGLGTEGLARMLNDKKFKPTIFNEIT